MNKYMAGRLFFYQNRIWKTRVIHREYDLSDIAKNIDEFFFLLLDVKILHLIHFKATYDHGMSFVFASNKQILRSLFISRGEPVPAIERITF